MSLSKILGAIFSLLIGILVTGGLVYLDGDMNKGQLDNTLVIISLLSLALNNFLKAVPPLLERFNNFIKNFSKACACGLIILAILSVIAFLFIELDVFFVNITLILGLLSLLLLFPNEPNVYFIYCGWWLFLAVIYCMKIKNINLLLLING
ncbi:hypothetical protein [Neisseria dentiae]|uniref:hypothetical protein n=1 Tax=Neisseria dentiae TaxID=194197 RepID=UPI0035A1CAC0